MSFAPLVLRWRLAPDISLVPLQATDLRLTFADGTALTLTPGHAGLRDALVALSGGADEPRLTAVAGEKTAELYYYLARMMRRGVLEASADLDGSPAVRLLPRNLQFELPTPADVPPSVALDRFAFLRRGERGATLLHPDATCDLLVVHPVAADLIGRLAAGALDAAALPHPLGRALTSLLMALGFADDAAAVEGASRRVWEFHDRLFQRATRSYDDLVPRGATYRFDGELAPPPTIRPAYPGASITLPQPPALSFVRSGSLLEVMEGRRSMRTMSDTPIGLDAVGALLHRVGRVTEVLRPDGLRRPYPSAGAIHELEFYLAVRACDGLTPGFYHYRGQEHALTRIADAEAAATAMLDDCATAWDQPDQPPQVLVVITSRLPRLAWKYAGIAYKISLMNAGVAIQSLYLVATDLGLAGSAAGSGNPELFARATGVSSWEETSIAEFGFGRPA